MGTSYTGTKPLETLEDRRGYWREEGKREGRSMYHGEKTTDHRGGGKKEYRESQPVTTVCEPSSVGRKVQEIKREVKSRERERERVPFKVHR